MSGEKPAPAGDTEDEPRDLLLEIEKLIASLRGEHGPAVRDDVDRLLQDIDAVHRAGLGHLMDAIRGMAGDAFINRLIADPAIRMLLMAYSLVPMDRRLMAEEALDMARGHLHAHGVDVEILEVVGGVVYIRIHRASGSAIPEEAVVHDIEEALQSGFVGFQELVTRGREQAPSSSTIPLSALRRANRPVYAHVADLADLAGGDIKAVEAGGQPVLLVRAGGEVTAIANRCGSSPLPLEFGSLDGTAMVCSWHGCRYDVRTGQRLDRGGEPVRVYPVRVEDQRILVAVDVAPGTAGT